MSSGFGEIVFTSTFKSGIMTTSNYTISGTMAAAMDNTFLLCIILVLCIIILIMLLCGAIYLCLCFRARRQRRTKQSKLPRTVVVCKSTSMTGLNCDRLLSKNAQVQVYLEGSLYTTSLDDERDKNTIVSQQNAPLTAPTMRLAPLQQKLITSTPTMKTESMIVSGGSGALVTSPQSTICPNDVTFSKHDLASAQSITCYTSSETYIDACNSYKQNHAPHSCLSPQENFTSQSPISPTEATEWQTGNEDLCQTSVQEPTQNICYGTAHSSLDNSSSTDANLPYQDREDSGDTDEHRGLLPNDCSFLESPSYDESPNSNGVTTSLPLDAYGHPRAWFVPLDELYHEPLRHSFIDVSNHDMKAFTPEELSKEVMKQQMCAKSAPVVSKATARRKFDKEIVQYDVFDDKDDDPECGSSWRDSGIPTPHTRVRSSNSSESEGKKLSVWEQREDRPVLFLDKQGEGGIIATELDQ
uniref:Uncharacterized protein LOC100180127 n=1 Tax=Phallusia mammillata TaxID=59560 RepID=A0A6F9DHN9_9ASCI|nr:uncharacterized protein LOC100180127 [Phallusia mammillata]